MYRLNCLLIAILLSLSIAACKNKKSGGTEEVEDPGILKIETTTNAVYIDEVIRIRASVEFLDDSVKDVTGVVESGGEARLYMIGDNLIFKVQRPRQLPARTVWRKRGSSWAS